MNQELIDIMDEFFSTTQYQGEIGDWNTTDETYEDPDEEIEEFSTPTIIRRYGGPGSGHHGHAGRPGMVGGSGVGGVKGNVFHGTSEKIGKKILKEGLIGFVDDFGNKPQVYASKNIGTALSYGYIQAEKEKSNRLCVVVADSKIFKVANAALDEREVVSLEKNVPLSEIKSILFYNKKDVERWFDSKNKNKEGPRPFEIIKTSRKLNVSESNDLFLFFSFLDGTKDKKAVTRSNKGFGKIGSISTIIRRYGGPGSGHHGHVGRPGVVGGSGSGGGGVPPTNKNGRWLPDAELLPGVKKSMLLDSIESKNWNVIKRTIPQVIQKWGKAITEHNFNVLHAMVDLIERGHRLKDIRPVLAEYENVVRPLMI